MTFHLLKVARCLFLLLCVFVLEASFARGFGGAGRPGGIGGPGNVGEPGRNYHYNAPGVDYYRPNRNWNDSAVIVTNPDAVYYNNTNCQTVRQCDANGTCIETNACD